ncbi:MAG: glycosyltransferase [Rhodobacteraceae bacterium]|nr:glycosyltransferase [Paracoccaceae bacterium]
MRVGYVLNTHPQVSTTFIRREMAALATAGVTVHRLAMRRPATGAVHPGDAGELSGSEYALDRGLFRLAVFALPALLRAPVRGFLALRLALSCGWRSERGVLVHLVYLLEAAWVAGRARALGLDRLHAHFGTNPAMVAMLAHVLGGLPFGFTVHGPEEFDAPRALALPAKLARADLAVAVSAFGQSQLMRWTDPARWDRIAVVRCGIEPAAFPAPRPLPPGPLRLLCIGRLAEQKGQLVLLAAVARLLADHPAARLVLAGDGPMRGAIEAAIAARGLGARVTITGWIDEERVREELAAAHALVLPSFAEGLPVVIMEAMAAGRPVVATTVAGIPELVVPGATGWLVPAGDAPALAAALAALAATPLPRLAAMGRAGRKRVLALHDAGVEARRLAALFARNGREGGGGDAAAASQSPAAAPE